jgi:hypothetical protein
LSRRALLRSAAATALTVPAAQGLITSGITSNFAGLRIVKPWPTTATTPEITLPDGYSIAPGSLNQFASPWQFYTSIQGPPSDRVPVTIHWPQEQVETVISKSARLPVRRHNATTVTVAVPVLDTKLDAANLQIRSALPTDASIFYRLEHNDRNRAAGVWTTVPWPTGPTHAVLNYAIASEHILRDSGLSATAASRGHTWYVTGFETYTTLHADNPPHWHLGYYPGPRDTPGSYMPHLWMDDDGRIFYNGLDIDGKGIEKYHVGEPAALKDAEGTTVVTLTIRADGGLDVDPPNGPHYSITPHNGGSPVNGVTIVKGGTEWLSITATDNTLTGHLTVRSNPGRTVVYPYDRHLGQLR